MGILFDVLSGSSRGPAFLPWVWELAAERAGLSTEDMAASATELVAAIRQATALVESDALVVLVADINSPSIEALERLAAAGDGHDRVAVIPGPATLALERGMDDPDDRDEATEELARVVFEARAQVLVIDEANPAPDTAACFRTLSRMAAHYGARALAIAPPTNLFLVEAGLDAIDGGDAGAAPAGVAVAAAPMALATLGVLTTSWPCRSSDAEAMRAMAHSVRTERDRRHRNGA